MIQIWKIPIRSRREDFEEDPATVHRARAYCFSEGWVGIGWDVDGLADNLTGSDVYRTKIAQSSVETLGFKKGPAFTAHNALARRLQAGDLAWCRAGSDVYWLGRVTGSWRYRNTGPFDDFDLYQVRRCAWHRVGPGDGVPGPVKNAYAGRGSAISQIQTEQEAAAYESARIWQRITGELLDLPERSGVSLSLSALGHDDLEDLVILYLQAKLGWFVVPSTAKNATPTTECVLKNAAGKRAYVQVKSGHAVVDTDVEVPTDVAVFYVFDPSSTVVSTK